VSACDGIQGEGELAAFSEQLAQTPYADVYASARTAVLREEIEEEPATHEFDGAVHKLLAEPLEREQKALEAMVSGTADGDQGAISLAIARSAAAQANGLAARRHGG
jgi:DNA primase